MALYTKKKDVERYVKELLSKVKTDDERKLKGFTIARMYHQVGEHRTARQYLTWYLDARPGAAPAHKLLGQVLAASGDLAPALAEFGLSLQLDSHQKDLVMTGCKLLLELPPNTHNAAFWLEHAIKYFKSDPIVLKLRQHLRGGVDRSQSGDDVDKLLAAELAAEPTDPERHVRLAERLVVSSGAAEALRYVSQVEERRPFPRSTAWYRCVADICQKYQGSVSSPDKSHQLLQLEALDRLVTLGLEQRQPTSEINTNLYRLDQLLLQATRDLEAAGEPQQTRLETAALVSHVTGQLFYHMGSLLLLGSTQGAGEAGGDGTREASDMALALFLAAQAYPPLETVSPLYQCSTRQASLDVWRRQAGARQVEVGWSILASESSNKPDHVLRVQQQFCTQKGRARIHSRVFRSGSVSGLGRADTSAFLTLPAFLETNPVTPRSAELLPLAQLFWQEHSGRLQHAVWLRLRAPSAVYQSPPAAGLPLQARGAAPAATAAPETLCLLDVLAFLEATVYVTSQLRAAAGRRGAADDILPPSVAGGRLCTEDQAQWWSAVHRLHGEGGGSGAAPAQQLATLRRQLQRGLEAVRCLPGHGSSVRLVMHLAHWSLQQALSEPVDQAEPYQARAELYLRAALPLLDQLQRGGGDSPPKQRLFDTTEAEPDAAEAALLRDEACRLLAGLLQLRDQLEDALLLVSDLPSADAAYQHGLILHQLAVRPDSEDSSELLRQSLESFYLTLDRLRDPVGSGSSQPSREDLAAQIKEVEQLIAEQSAASTHVNGTRSAEAALERSLASRWLPAVNSRTSTPRRPATATAFNTTVNTTSSPHSLSNSFGQEARPSVERLCAELQGLKVAVKALADQSRQPPPYRDTEIDQWPQRMQELRDGLLADVRSLLAEELPQLRQEVQQLRREVAQQREKQETQQQQPQPQPPVMPPELFGYMAALAGMQRGVPPMMAMPPAMPYSPYQGLPLQDTSLQDPLASQTVLAAQLAAQSVLVGPQSATPPVVPSAVQPATPSFSFRPAAAEGATSTVTPSAVQPGTPSFSFRPAAAEDATSTPTPSVPVMPSGVQPATPSFTFQPYASEVATSTPTKPSAPANVTVSSREPLPPAVSTMPAVPPSVIVPIEHIKPQVMTPQQPTMGVTAIDNKSPHQFQIMLPSSAQLNVASPLGDSDKPAYSNVSTLPNIPAPQFSAVSPLQGRHQQTGRSPGRDRLDSTGSFHEDPEYEPMADFKPVVALPEEVEVHTGEEGDTQLFAARCKLFRFTEGEWKERGIGEMHVLHREDDGRVRLVMRREQTHKVCANHFLQPGMELNSMKNQPRAVIWAAKDFADEELKDERLCARFKTEEEVEKFRAAFQKGKDLIKAASGKGAPSAPPAKVTFASFAKTTPTAPAAAPAPLMPFNIPSVVAAGDDDNAEEGDDDDSYETEEETTSDEDDDEEPLRIACKPQFNFSSGAKSTNAFSFGLGNGAPPAATTAAPATGFKFGDKAPAATTTFAFGFRQTTSATPAVSATSTADSGFKFGQTLTSGSFTTLASTAADSGTTPASKASLGGFSFTATPTIKKSEPVAAATSQSESKPSPFAGFSFCAAAQESSLCSLNFAAAADSGPGFKKDDSFKGFVGSGVPVFGRSPVKTAEGEDADTTAEDYEPSVHFEPVVPLPELVETKTGEEADEKMFGHRAKLYRMDVTTKEWKERGVGEIKILKNRDTGKCRVLMRREQVLKLCANHVILPEMALSPLQSSQSAWVWSANDFSEGEASQETLAVKFKTPELAQQFKEAFESCQKSSAADLTQASAAKPSEPAKPAAQPASVPTAFSSATAVTSTPAASSAAETPTRSSFVFGVGTPAATPGQFHFSGVKPKSPVKPRSRDVSLNESAVGDDNDYYQGDEGEHLLFEPVVPLPDKVEVKTGEEEEEVLYSHRTKLYRFAKDTGEWKERGLGDVKLLDNRQTHKIRLLMRREQVLKICMNHRLTPELEFKLKDDRSVVWAATDYSEPEPRDEMFVARFKTPEIAAEFLAAVQKAQGRVSASPVKSTPAPATCQSQSQPEKDSASASFTFRLPATTTVTVTATATDTESDSDVTIVGEVQPTAEQRAAATCLQLPAGFYLYQQRPACPGCRGCRDQMPGECKGQYTSEEDADDSAATAASSSEPATSAANPSFQFKAASFAFGGDQSKASESAPKATFAFGASSAAASPFKFSVGDDANKSGSSIFGVSSSETKPTSIFGGTPTSESKSTSIFGGATTSESKPASIFGGATTSETKPTSIFGGTPTSETKTTSLFGSPSIFGGTGTDKPAFLFGGASTASGDKSTTGDSSAESKATSIFSGLGTDGKSGLIFGGVGTDDKTSSLFNSGPVFGSSAGGWPVFGSSKETVTGQSAAPAAETATVQQTTFGLGLQSSGPVVDFASLAKSGEPVGAKAVDPSFHFSGAGATLFGGPRAAADGDGEEGDEAAGADDSTHDPHFEPIVPLPELVDVKTGEEDEQQMFCHRAILYRFNKDTSEWKERGRGNFKLLHNTNTGSYRVLLRREQVHKLACNHRVLPDMALTRLGTSDRAWVWSAMDYADEEPKAETFAVKFKTDALADEYKKAFESALQKLGEVPANDTRQQAEAEAEDEQEYEDDDSPMFEKHATLHTYTGNVWKLLGSGDLHVLYDDDMFGVRVMMEKQNTEEVLCDLLITLQHKYLVDGKTVSWTALDYALDPPVRRPLRASFDSSEAAEELARVMDEGVEIASGAGIGDTEETGGAAAGSGAAAAGRLLGACDPEVAQALAELLAESASAAAPPPPPPPPADEE